MRNILIIFLILFTNLYSFEWKVKNDLGKENKLIFSVKVLDLRYADDVEYKYRGLLKLKYYENNIIEIETLENIKKSNILKVNKNYREILSSDKNIFLKNISFNKKDFERTILEYFNPTYIQIENQEVQPVFLGRGYSKYKKSNQILYDVNYKNQNFILSENIEKYKDKNIRKFILFVLEVMEKIDCEVYEDYFYCERGVNYEKID